MQGEYNAQEDEGGGQKLDRFQLTSLSRSMSDHNYAQSFSLSSYLTPFTSYYHSPSLLLTFLCDRDCLRDGLTFISLL